MVIISLLFACSSSEKLFNDHYDQALKYIETGQYPEARIELINALKYRPGDRDSSLVLIRVLKRLNNHRGAISVCRTFLEKNPGDHEVTIVLGQTLLETGNHEGVRELLDIPEISDPDYLMLLSQSLVFTGELDRAVQLAHRAAEQDGERIELLSNEFQILLRAGYLSRAGTVLERMKLLAPESDLVLISQVNYLNANGDTENARQVFRKLLDRHPDDPVYQLKFADFLENLGEIDEAVNLLERFLGRNDHAVTRARYGQLLKQSGDFEGARTSWLRAMELDNTLLQPKWDLIHLYFETGRSDQAIELVETTLKAHPGNPGMLALQGEIHFKNGAYGEAADSLRQALEAMPDRSDWRLMLARALIASGSRVSARQILRDVLQTQEHSAEARYLFARLEMGAGSLDQAAAHAVAASRDETYGREAMWILGDASLMMNGPASALDIHQRTENLHGDHPGTTMRIAWALEKLGRSGEAISHYNSVLDDQPGNMSALASLVRLLLNEGKKDEALEAARTYNSDGSPTRSLFLANVLELTRRFGEAEDIYLSLMEREPGFTPVYSRYVRLLAKQGRLGEAEDLLKRQLNENDARPALWTLLGTVYDAAGKRSDAVAAYRKALTISPGFVPVLNNLAWDLAEDGQLEEALKYASQAVRLSPNDGYARDTHGWILYKLGDSQSAILELEKAAELLPDHDSIRMHLEDVLAALGRKGEAETYLDPASERQNVQQ